MSTTHLKSSGLGTTHPVPPQSPSKHDKAKHRQSIQPSSFSSTSSSYIQPSSSSEGLDSSHISTSASSSSSSLHKPDEKPNKKDKTKTSKKNKSHRQSSINSSQSTYESGIKSSSSGEGLEYTEEKRRLSFIHKKKAHHQRSNSALSSDGDGNSSGGSGSNLSVQVLYSSSEERLSQSGSPPSSPSHASSSPSHAALEKKNKRQPFNSSDETQAGSPKQTLSPRHQQTTSPRQQQGAGSPRHEYTRSVTSLSVLSPSSSGNSSPTSQPGSPTHEDKKKFRLSIFNSPSKSRIPDGHLSPRSNSSELAKPHRSSSLFFLSKDDKKRRSTMLSASMDSTVVIGTEEVKVEENDDGGAGAYVDTNATHIALDSLNLQRIPRVVFKCERLVELIFDDNQVTEIPAAISQLTTLEILKGNGNALSHIVDEISYLSRLTELSLQRNELKSVPNALRLDALVDLRLDFNSFVEFPNSLGQLPSLTRLSMSHNRLVELPSCLSSLTSLSHLLLSYNQIQIFPSTNLPTNLQVLDLRHNNLMGEAPSPAFLQACTSLQQLKLSHNRIQILPAEVENLVKLTELSMRHNLLYTLPPSLGKCSAIKILKLDNNKIDFLPPEVCFMQQLEHIVVRNNAIQNMPAYLMDRKVKCIRKYFNNFHLETRPCTKIKLMIVGQEAVGKTTLLRALKGSRTSAPPLSTDGIDVLNWKVKLEGKSYIKFSCWDFAGQEVYYTTHQFFMSKGAVYLVVWNLKDPEYSRLDFWLSSIEASGGGICAMVGTHADDPMCTDEYIKQQTDLIQERYLDKYPFIRLFSLVDSKNGSGIEQLKEKLTELAKLHPQYGRTLPPSFVLLEEAVAKAAKSYDPPIMSWFTYRQLGVACSINDEEVLLQATLFLHSLGSLIYFPSRHSGLQDMVILKPQFLPDLMTTIISTKSTFVTDGILKHSDLGLVWKQYSPNLYPQFVLLLEKFGILCRLQDVSTSEKLAAEPLMGSKHSLFRETLANNTNKLNQFLQTPSVKQLFRSPSFVGSYDFFRASLASSSSGSVNTSFTGRTSASTASASYSSTSSSYANSTNSYGPPSSSSGGSTRSGMSSDDNFGDPVSLDADKSLVPLMLPVNDTINSLLPKREKCIGREFSFRFLGPGVFARLIVRLISYTRQHNNKQTEGAGWEVKYAKGQIYLSHSGTSAVATEHSLTRKISVMVWGQHSARLLSLITRAIALLMEDCYPGYVMTIHVPCSHCLQNEQENPKMWRLSELEDIVLQENALSPEVICDREGEVPVLIKDLIPDLALSDLPIISLDDVELTREVAKGSFGEVHSGNYKGLSVAVKFIKNSSANALKEFVHEAAFLSQLQCPYIVSLLGVTFKPLCMHFEFMRLGTLQDFLQSVNAENPLSMKVALRMALDIATGCQFLHSQTPPCIHSDLKSPNILLTKNGDRIVCKIGDLGLSRFVFAPLNTRTVDNPRWLAPEILASQEYSEMADLYSYAIICWEIFSTAANNIYTLPYEEFNCTFNSILEPKIIEGIRPTMPKVSPIISAFISDCWQGNYFQRPSFDSILPILETVTKSYEDNDYSSQC